MWKLFWAGVLSVASFSVFAGTPPQSVIVTAHPVATQAGQTVLENGGNAFDAAVAITATLGVVEPYGSGLGGGGFYLLHEAASGQDLMLDARETAPGQAHRDMYLDAQGNPIDALSIAGGMAAGIPGIPAALDALTQRFGQLELAVNLAPAVQAAKQGFAVHEQYQRLAGFRLEHMQADPATAALFLQQNEVPELGFRVTQPQLADTLNILAEQGRDGFYEGVVAASLVEAVNAAGGIWTLDDLAEYRLAVRKPIVSHYQGHQIISAPPPSSGGIAIAQTLNLFAVLMAQHPNADTATRQHLLIESMRRAYRDRADYLGDSDFVEMPVQRLLSEDYAAGLAAGVHPQRAGQSVSLAPVVIESEGRDTTHFSILDTQGNYVAATLSLNYPFGAAVTDPKTGVLLNDEMDDFSKKPGEPNVYGLIGNQANAIEPGKRPLSSMSPTFVRSDEQLAVLGTPGGSRIISMVIQAIDDVVMGKPIADWVARGRWHHQYLPDEITYEQDRVDAAIAAQLESLGHAINPVSAYGDMQALHWNKTEARVEGVADPRRHGVVAIIEEVGE